MVTTRKNTEEQCVRVSAKIVAESALEAGCRLCDGRLQVGIASSGHDAERQAGVIVSLLLVPSNVGRRRWWFECPGCARQVQALYVPPAGLQLSCRHCHNL